MAEYTLIYKIEVTADSPQEAALEGEATLKELWDRPHFTVIDSEGNETEIDLSEEIVEE